MTGEPLARGEVINLLQQHHRPLSARRLLMLVAQNRGEPAGNYGVMLSTLRSWAREDEASSSERSSEPRQERLIELRKGVFAVQEPNFDLSEDLETSQTHETETSAAVRTRAPRGQGPKLSKADDQPTRHTSGTSLGQRSVFTARAGQQRPVKPLQAVALREAQRISDYLAPYPVSPVKMEDVFVAIERHEERFESELWEHLLVESSRALQSFGYPESLLQRADTSLSPEREVDGDEPEHLQGLEPAASESLEAQEPDIFIADLKNAEELERDPIEDGSLEAESSLLSAARELSELGETLDQLNERYHQILREGLCDYLESLDTGALQALLTHVLKCEGYQSFESLNQHPDERRALLAHHPEVGGTLVMIEPHHSKVTRGYLNQLKRSLKNLNAERSLILYLGEVDASLPATDESIRLLSHVKLAQDMIEYKLGVKHLHISRAHIDIENLQALTSLTLPNA